MERLKVIKDNVKFAMLEKVVVVIGPYTGYQLSLHYRQGHMFEHFVFTVRKNIMLYFLF